MPGVSAEEHHQAYSLESSIAGSFYTDNGYVIPVSGLDFMDPGAQADFERSSPSRDSNLGRRFFAKSLSMGSGSCYAADDAEIAFADGFGKDGGPKEEVFMAGSPLSGPFYGALAGSSSEVAIGSLQKFLPSNNEDEASWPAVDVYSCDEFRMYEFKVRRCMRGRSHDWTECPFAHPGEKARRRDPRRFHYSGTACPDFRKGSCRRGDACEFAHGVFECWLHPARYRTQPCKDGRNCRRRVCFFAHTPEQLRLLPGANSGSRALKNSSYDGSPLRHAVSASNFDGSFVYDGSGGGCYDGGSQTVGSPRGGHMAGYLCKAAQQSNLSCASQFQMSSPTSTLVGHSHSPPPLSPPLSPTGSPPLSPDSAANWALGYGISCSSPVARGLKSLNYGNNNFDPPVSHAPLAQVHASLGLQSPRRHPASNSSPKPASQPSKAMADLITSLQQLELSGEATPLWLQAHAAAAASAGSVPAIGHSSPRGSNLRHCSYSLPCTPTKPRWETKFDNWEAEAVEEPLQRVESGRDLRAKIYGRLSKENPENSESPDLGWVNELIK